MTTLTKIKKGKKVNSVDFDAAGDRRPLLFETWIKSNMCVQVLHMLSQMQGALEATPQREN